MATTRRSCSCVYVCRDIVPHEDGYADDALEPKPVNAVLLVIAPEAIIRHGIGAKDAILRGQHVIGDRARRDDLGALSAAVASP